MGLNWTQTAFLKLDVMTLKVAMLSNCVSSSHFWF